MLRIGLIFVFFAILAIAESARTPRSQFPVYSSSIQDSTAGVSGIATGATSQELFVRGGLEGSEGSLSGIEDGFTKLEMTGRMHDTVGIQTLEKLLEAFETFHKQVDTEDDKPIKIFLPASFESEEHEDQDTPVAPLPMDSAPMSAFYLDIDTKNENVEPLQVQEKETINFLPPTIEIENHVPSYVQVQRDVGGIEQLSEAKRQEFLTALDDMLSSHDGFGMDDFQVYLVFLLMIIVTLLGFYLVYMKRCRDSVTQLVVDQVRSYDGQTIVLLVPLQDKCSCPPEVTTVLDHSYLEVDVKKLEKQLTPGTV